jgi:glycine/D-amino acid oxidase-like deaminating enzyme
MKVDPPTLWHATGMRGARYAAATGKVETDLLVIGAGFAGLSTALHAAQAGLRVTLLEAERIAWGASGRNAGFVVPNFAKVDPGGVLTLLGPERGAALNLFAAESADLVFDLVRRHAIDCDADRSGWIQPAHSSIAFAAIRSRASQWQSLGRPVEVLDADAVTSLTGITGYYGGMIDRSGGVLNPVSYARGLARAASAAGADLHEDSEVTQLVRSGQGWMAATRSAQIHASRVVVATNATPGKLIAGLARTFIPLKVFQVATMPLPLAVRQRFLPGNQCVSDTRRNLFTFRFDAENRLISGGMHIIGLGANQRIARSIHARLARRLGLTDLPPLAYAWSGTAAVMPDFLPTLMDIAPGMIAGFACNGRGIAMTTRLGQEMARWAQGAPLADLAVPSRRITPIALHHMLKLAPQALLPVSMMRDHLDQRKP